VGGSFDVPGRDPLRGGWGGGGPVGDVGGGKKTGRAVGGGFGSSGAFFSVFSPSLCLGKKTAPGRSFRLPTKLDGNFGPCPGRGGRSGRAFSIKPDLGFPKTERGLVGAIGAAFWLGAEGARSERGNAGGGPRGGENEPWDHFNPAGAGFLGQKVDRAGQFHGEKTAARPRMPAFNGSVFFPGGPPTWRFLSPGRRNPPEPGHVAKKPIFCRRARFFCQRKGKSLPRLTLLGSFFFSVFSPSRREDEGGTSVRGGSRRSGAAR